MARSRGKKSPATPIAAALRDGDGSRFLRLIAMKPPDRLKAIGAKIDQRRWDAMPGRALVGAGEWLLELPDDVVRDFLPALAIAAVRLRRWKGNKVGTQRAHANRVFEALKPYVARSEWVADMIARSGCHYYDTHELPEHAADMLELARGCKAMKQNPWFAELTKRVGQT